MKILILGAHGMLGHDLIEVFKKDHEVYTWDKKELDITNKKVVQEKFTKLAPDIVINTAAYTNVDGCETNKDICMEINGRAPGYIAQACKTLNSVLVHFSTDYVFDGQKEEGYKEDDEIDPINTYGESKALGEKGVVENTSNYYLIRTSWLYGKHGKNFVDTMLHLAKERDTIEVVNDQFGKPTYTRDLAKRIKEIIEEKRDFGIYHVTNEGVTSWYDFAKKIFELAKLEITVKPVTTGQFPRPAKRPKYSALINTKLPKMRSWHEALKEYLSTH